MNETGERAIEAGRLTRGQPTAGQCRSWPRSGKPDGAYGEEINLPAPLSFSLATAGWPRWK